MPTIDTVTLKLKNGARITLTCPVLHLKPWPWVEEHQRRLAAKKITTLPRMIREVSGGLVGAHCPR